MSRTLIRSTYCTSAGALFAAVAIVSGPARTACAADYAVIDLGTIVPGSTAGPGSMAYALGNDGSVAGESVVGDLDGLLYAFVWQDDALTPLAPPTGLRHAVATAAIDADHVYGTAYDLGAIGQRAVLWDHGAPTDLGAWELTDVAADGTAVGGSVAGSAAAYRRPVRWASGLLTNLPTLGGTSGVALAVADNGDIAGISSLVGNSSTRAVLWRGGGPIELGTLGGPSSRGHDVNELGQVAGDADLSGGGFHACRFDVAPNGTVSRTDLGALGAYSSGRAINAAGDVVGTSNSRAFIHRNGSMTDLNTLIDPAQPWHLAVANDIDDAGRIVGSGVHAGQPRAFLLLPIAAEDLNGDGTVNFADLLLVIAAWGPCGSGPCPEDLNGNGDVDFADIFAVIGAWG